MFSIVFAIISEYDWPGTAKCVENSSLVKLQATVGLSLV